MAEDRDLSFTAPRQTSRSGQTNLKESTKYNFRIQSAPPLSIQQFLRSATGVIVGAKQWQPSGKYREPIFRAYLSPAVRQKRKTTESAWHATGPYKEKRPTSLSPEKRPQERISEPVWQPPGHYKEKPPTSLSPEKRPQEHIPEPVWQPPGHYKEKRPTSLSPEKRPQKSVPLRAWHPVGKVEHKPVPYFDPPNLRWSLQELRRSMGEMRPKTFHTSRSMSAVRKSEEIQET